MDRRQFVGSILAGLGLGTKKAVAEVKQETVTHSFLEIFKLQDSNPETLKSSINELAEYFLQNKITYKEFFIDEGKHTLCSVQVTVDEPGIISLRYYGMTKEIPEQEKEGLYKVLALKVDIQKNEVSISEPNIVVEQYRDLVQSLKGLDSRQLLNNFFCGTVQKLFSKM